MNPVPVPPTNGRPRRTLSLAAALLALGAASLLAGCGEDSSTPSAPAPPPAPAPEPAPPPPPPEPETVTYLFAQPEDRIGPRQPGTLPEGVSFSAQLILVAHARDAGPFAVGETASDGMKLLAETGSPAALIESGGDSFEVVADGLGRLLQIFLSPEPAIEMHLARPCLSYAERIEPSPDWFIGFDTVCATDENGVWLDMIATELLAYDAGTAEGSDYAAKVEGADTLPREPITLLDKPPHFIAPAIVQVLTATRRQE